MEQRLVTVSPPPGGVYRLSRGPAEPFDPPEWERAQEDGTFGNRFDDPSAKDGTRPEERFRVIYCATQRGATFGETVARFRPDLDLLASLDVISDEESVAEALAGAVDPKDPRRGLILADWRLKRRIGHTVLDPSLGFVDIASAETMQYLRNALAPLADQLGLSDVDLGSVTGSNRSFTQECARYLHDQTDDVGNPVYAGIRYPSRLKSDWECWAVFDDRIRHASGHPGFPTTFHADDEDLMEVARLFNLTIEVFPGQGQFLRP